MRWYGFRVIVQVQTDAMHVQVRAARLAVRFLGLCEPRADRADGPARSRGSFISGLDLPAGFRPGAVGAACNWPAAATVAAFLGLLRQPARDSLGV